MFAPEAHDDGVLPDPCELSGLAESEALGLVGIYSTRSDALQAKETLDALLALRLDAEARCRYFATT